MSCFLLHVEDSPPCLSLGTSGCACGVCREQRSGECRWFTVRETRRWTTWLKAVEVCGWAAVPLSRPADAVVLGHSVPSWPAPTGPCSAVGG